MAWRTTEEAPPAEWRWDDEEAELGGMGAEEEGACGVVYHAIRESRPRAFRDLTVLELGCGRGVCLRWARQHGAGRIIGVDRAEGALRASRLCLGDDIELVQAEATATGLGSGYADLVWSHGVVEHFRPGELEPYLAEAVRLSRGWVAFSAPNPACAIYTAFRDVLLAAEAWTWGYEEPLPSYAAALRALGCDIVVDTDVGKGWPAYASYAARLPEPEQEAWQARVAAGAVRGIYTVVVARVRAGEGA